MRVFMGMVFTMCRNNIFYHKFRNIFFAKVSEFWFDIVSVKMLCQIFKGYIFYVMDSGGTDSAIVPGAEFEQIKELFKGTYKLRICKPLSQTLLEISEFL